MIVRSGRTHRRHIIPVIPLLLVGAVSYTTDVDRTGRTDGLISIPDEVTCPECRIELVEIALLGGPSDPAAARDDAAGRGCMVGRLSDGRFLFSGPLEPGYIYLYDDQGVLLERWGGSGQGPGEFGPQVRIWIGPGDTVFVQDGQQRRMTVLSPDGEHIETFGAPGWNSFTRFPDGSFLYFTQTLTPQDFLFSHIGPDGDVLRSYGRPTLAEPDLESWQLKPARRGGYWAASLWVYEMEERTIEGEPLRTIRRNAPWFPGSSSYSDDMYVTEPPPPFFDHLWEAKDGLLWAYTLVPDPAWEPGLGMRPSPEWYRRTFDTVIEVLDFEEGTVLARKTYDGRLGAVCGSNLLYTVLVTDDGDHRVQVLEPRLVTSEFTR